MALRARFSKRNRYSRAGSEIVIREDAPESLRYLVLQTAIDLGWTPLSLRAIICRELCVPPEPGNLSEYPDVWNEVENLMYRCDWYKVYDIIEAMYARFTQHEAGSQQKDAVQFAQAMNSFFEEEGIGWQLTEGQIITRGTETFELAVHEAMESLRSSERWTATNHLHEAQQALSRRPEPDLAGAVYHAMGALEYVARDVVGDPKATLGEILKRYPDILPRPLEAALSQLWGYVCSEARQVADGHKPGREEAELVVGLSAAVSIYLTRKPH